MDDTADVFFLPYDGHPVQTEFRPFVRQPGQCVVDVYGDAAQLHDLPDAEGSPAPAGRGEVEECGRASKVQVAHR